MAIPMDIDSDDSDILPPEPKLVLYGTKVNRRFTRYLHPQQVTALDKISDWFADPEKTNKTAVISMPTGSGKSGVICSLPYRLGADVATNGLAMSKPILVIAPGITILEQLHNDLELRDNNTFLVRRGILRQSELPFAHYLVKRIQTSRDISRQGLGQVEIVLVNAQKGHGRGAAGIPTWVDLDPSYFSTVIVDEAHHLPAPQWSRIVERFRSNAKLVFFTATPYRSDRRNIVNDIHQVGLAYHLPRQQAIESNIIRKVTMTCIPHCTTTDTTEESYYEQILLNVKHKIDEKNLWQPLPGGVQHMAILIAPDIQRADDIADKWNELFPGTPGSPLSAASIHSRLPQRERQDIRERLRGGQLKLIVIVQMLLEGFDHPPISIAAIATRIRSPVKFAQFIGRAQRIVRHDGAVEQHGVANVVTHEYFEQSENYELFRQEYYIPLRDEESQ